MCRTLAFQEVTAQQKTTKCVDVERHPDLISPQSRTGKLASAQGSSISLRPRKSPERALRYTKAGERDWNVRWQISFSICTPASTVTRKFFLLSLSTAPPCSPPANCQNLPPTSSRFRTPISGLRPPAKWNFTTSIATRPFQKTNCQLR